MSREDIARQREIARAKADLRRNLIDVFWCLVYGVICVASNSFATQMMLFILGAYHVPMGFAMGFTIVLTVTIVVSVGTFIGVKFAK